MAGTSAGGAKSKDKSLSGRPSPKRRSAKPSTADVRQAKLLVKQAEDVKKKEQADLDKLKRELDAAQRVVAGKIDDDEPDLDDDEENDDKSAHKMLQDMRYVYRKANGRSKLLKLIKSDDRQFMALVKELMKIEAALMAAKIKKDGDGNGGMSAFVVLKGLEDAAPVMSALLNIPSTINLNQIDHALNPTLTEPYEERKEIIPDAEPSDAKSALLSPDTW